MAFPGAGWFPFGKLRIVRGLRAVFNPVAIVGEGIDAPAVVVLEARKIHVRRLHELFARGALGCGDGFGKQRIRRFRFQSLSGAGVAHHEVLDLADFSGADLQAQAENDGIVPLTHGADETRLTGLGFGEIKLEGSQAVCGLPEPSPISSFAVFSR